MSSTHTAAEEYRGRVTGISLGSDGFYGTNILVTEVPGKPENRFVASQEVPDCRPGDTVIVRVTHVTTIEKVNVE